MFMVLNDFMIYVYDNDDNDDNDCDDENDEDDNDDNNDEDCDEKHLAMISRIVLTSLSVPGLNPAWAPLQ